MLSEDRIRTHCNIRILIHCNVCIIYVYAMIPFIQRKNRHNRSVMLKGKIVVTFEGEGSDCKRARGGCWGSGNVLFLDLDIGYMAVFPW